MRKTNLNINTMMNAMTNQIIAYGLTQEEAQAAMRAINNKFMCAPEYITVTTDPSDIFSLRAGEVNLVGVKAHESDQQQWTKLMPVCRYMRANDIKYLIIK